MEYDELLTDYNATHDDDDDGDVTTAYITGPYITAMKHELVLLQKSCKVFTAVDMIPDYFSGIDGVGCTKIDSIFTPKRTRPASTSGT
jgi:hypothetical protein